MANLKSILLVCSFIVFTLIGENTTVASPIQDEINQALALINEAIDKVLEEVEEAIDEYPAPFGEIIDDAFTLVEEAIDRSITLIEQAIDERIIEEDFEFMEDIFNKDLEDAIKAIACRLKQNQVNVCGCEDTSCECGATWPEEENCTGSIVAGIVCAYEITEDCDYITCAEYGGNYILSAAKGNFCGDEVYALCRLSQISNDPSDNLWRKAVSDFYRDIKSEINGTEGYICQFVDIEPSIAVFHLAYYVVAAHYVDAEDKEIWRKALIDYLARTGDDCSDSPVMGLGIATWSLAETGPLDDTLIDPYATGILYWNGKKLEDLPALLVSHQVPDGDLCAGSFYWRFDHDDGDSGCCVSGYTEDTIFATLGLISASQTNSDLHLDAAINTACQALLDAVNNEGIVVEHLGTQKQNSNCCTYGGEMLLVFSVLTSNDITIDDLKRI